MTMTAHRIRRGETMLYVMPYETASGRPVVFRQDVETFETKRSSMTAGEARQLRREGREVPLGSTPAWCDPEAPRTGAVRST